jgi:hypothetical protein
LVETGGRFVQIIGGLIGGRFVPTDTGGWFVQTGGGGFVITGGGFVPTGGLLVNTGGKLVPGGRSGGALVGGGGGALVNQFVSAGGGGGGGMFVSVWAKAWVNIPARPKNTENNAMLNVLFITFPVVYSFVRN